MDPLLSAGGALTSKSSHPFSESAAYAALFLLKKKFLKKVYHFNYIIKNKICQLKISNLENRSIQQRMAGVRMRRARKNSQIDGDRAYASSRDRGRIRRLPPAARKANICSLSHSTVLKWNICSHEHMNNCSYVEDRPWQHSLSPSASRRNVHPHVIPCVLGRFHVFHFHY